MLVSATTVFTLGALIRATNYLSGPFLFGLFAMCLLMACERRARRQARLARRVHAPKPAPQATEARLFGWIPDA
jgi:hypothetical protein